MAIYIYIRITLFPYIYTVYLDPIVYLHATIFTYILCLPTMSLYPIVHSYFSYTILISISSVWKDYRYSIPIVSVCLAVCLSACLSVCLCVISDISIYRSVYLSICLSTDRSRHILYRLIVGIHIYIYMILCMYVAKF